MATFKLVEITEVPGKHRPETCWHFADENDNHAIFHMHPTKAWNWVILRDDAKNSSHLIEKVMDANFDEDKIQVLKV